MTTTEELVTRLRLVAGPKICYEAADRLVELTEKLQTREHRLDAYEREIHRLRQELEGVRRDAERYRWLREHGAGIELPDDTYTNQVYDSWLGTTALDAAIDAAQTK